jgi:DinB superfamily
MRKTLALCILAAVPILAAETGAMNDSERAFLIEQLEKSKKDFLASIDGLTDAQWKFKPAPEVWSVAECSEHIVLAEGFIGGGARMLLNSPVVDRPPTSTEEHDHEIVGMIGDRSHKAKAPEQITPGGTKFATPADAAAAFTAARDKSLEYARTTTDALRVHVTKGPVGPMDAYQLLLLMAAHTGRHTLQIQEVEANPGYPKATAQLIGH